MRKFFAESSNSAFLKSSFVLEKIFSSKEPIGSNDGWMLEALDSEKSKNFSLCIHPPFPDSKPKCFCGEIFFSTASCSPEALE